MYEVIEWAIWIALRWFLIACFVTPFVLAFLYAARDED